MVGLTFIDRFRWQIPFTCLVGFAVQWLVGIALFDAMVLTPSTFNSFIASVGASFSSLVLYRQMRTFPGAKGMAYLLPSFVAGYGLAILAMFALRLPYSSVLLFVGFTVTFSQTWLLAIQRHRSARQTLYVIPSESTRKLVREAPMINWIILEEPRLPRSKRYSIVADLRSKIEPEWERLIARAAVSGSPVYHFKQTRESLTGRVQIDHLSENNFGSLIPNHFYATLKRAIDLLVAFGLLVILAAPMALVALAVRLDSDGPFLFRQRRMGYRGKPFTILKFRTMSVVDSPLMGEDARNAAMTRNDDNRITRLGRFLRRSRLDELPQLINVLKGEMSLIGPRPEALELSSWYDTELAFYTYRHIVRPGITGWAQVNQGHVAALDDVLVKLHYDFYYIKNFSAWLDILIAMRTVGIILLGTGAK